MAQSVNGAANVAPADVAQKSLLAGVKAVSERAIRCAASCAPRRD